MFPTGSFVSRLVSSMRVHSTFQNVPPLLRSCACTDMHAFIQNCVFYGITSFIWSIKVCKPYPAHSKSCSIWGNTRVSKIFHYMHVTRKDDGAERIGRDSKLGLTMVRRS